MTATTGASTPTSSFSRAWLHVQLMRFQSEGNDQACVWTQHNHERPCAFFFFFLNHDHVVVYWQRQAFCQLLPSSTHQGCLFQRFAVLTQWLLQGENATEPFGATVVKKKNNKKKNAHNVKRKWCEWFSCSFQKRLQVDEDKIFNGGGLNFFQTNPSLVKMCHLSQTTPPGSEGVAALIAAHKHQLPVGVSGLFKGSSLGSAFKSLGSGVGERKRERVSKWVLVASFLQMLWHLQHNTTLDLASHSAEGGGGGDGRTSLTDLQSGRVELSV